MTCIRLLAGGFVFEIDNRVLNEILLWQMVFIEYLSPCGDGEKTFMNLGVGWFSVEAGEALYFIGPKEIM